jgi:hypothetical protein
VQESPDSNLNHVFPHLAFTSPLQAGSCVFVPFPSQEPSTDDPFASIPEREPEKRPTSPTLVLPPPSDPFTRLEPGQVFEQRVTAEPVSNTFNAQESPADTYSGSSRVT